MTQNTVAWDLAVPWQVGQRMGSHQSNDDGLRQRVVKGRRGRGGPI